MGFAETVGLGAIAGSTIFIGLPLGKLRILDERARVGLAMFSVGILAFIFMDVSKHGEAIRLRVWERGAGLTQACGTGACATAVAAISRKLVASPVTVHLPGGALAIACSPAAASR